jgi:uncharacterized cupin superfamily protein
MQVFNVFAERQDWDAEGDGEGYRHRRVAIGPRLGAALAGMSLYELPPGEGSWPYHYELGCEEWLVVVSGRPTLRTPAGERRLEPGETVVFPEGPDGAHALRNDTDETVRVLLLSSKSPVAVVRYPDSGKVGVWTAANGYELMVRDGPTLDYWEGE